MAESDTHHELAGLLVATARAHHEATGGVNPEWADWYAERLIDDVNRLLASEMDADELARWLTDADRRYRDEEPDISWPKAYASWLLGDAD